MTLSAGTITAIKNGRAVNAFTFLFEIAGVTYRFWSGVGPITWNGDVYLGSGQLLQVTFPASQSGGVSDPFTITLAATRDALTATDTINQLAGSAYRRAPVVIGLLFFSPDTAVPESHQILQTGYIDVIDKTLQSGEYSFVAQCEVGDMDDLDVGEMIRTNSSKRLAFPTETGFANVAKVAEYPMRWGSAEPKKKKATA